MTDTTEQTTASPVDLAYFEQVLQYLQEIRGVDFTAYKPTSLQRRVAKRMQVLGVPTFEAYFEYLHLHQDEFNALFNTILINVTSFFRDPDVWVHLAGQILPSVIEARQNDVVRIWSAGCAGGHEPYTIAMLLAEQVGAEALHQRVKIYATDVDEESLAEARAATYPARQMADIPPDLVDKYFDRSRSRYAVRHHLRRAISFGRHDLVRDAPIPRIDLLICRNTLMYFQSDAQARILARVYSSVNPGGYLLLGRAEMLFRDTAVFQAVDVKRRVFRPVPAIR